MNLNYNSLGFGRDATLKKKGGSSSYLHSEPRAARSSWWHVCCLLIMSVFLGQGAFAQVAAYSFSSGSQTYTPLAAFTAITADAGLTSGGSDDGYAHITIPFNFTFKGVSSNQVTMSTNGWVGMGFQTPTASQGRSQANMFNNTVPNDLIGGFFRDGAANFGAVGQGEMRHGLSGTEVYTFEFYQFTGSGFSASGTIRYSFQISIYGPGSSSPGLVTINYGPRQGAISTGATAIGLGGINTDYFNAVTGNSIATTTTTAFPALDLLYTFTPPNVCSGTPAPGNTIASAAACSGVNFNLSLQNATPGSGVTYLWESADDLAFTTNVVVVPGNAAVVPTSQTSAKYYRATVTCGANSGVSTPVFVAMDVPTNCYCTSVPSSNDDLGVTNVLLNGTDFPTGDVTYVNHTGTTVNLQQGSTVENVISFATGFTYNVNTYIDLNNDGDFTDAGELVFQGESLATNPTVFDASFVLANDATPGVHRMRIQTNDFAAPTPCYNGSFGVTLDFSVNIEAGSTDTVDYANIQFPSAATISAGDSVTVFAQVYEAGLTDVDIANQAAGITAWIGISPIGDNSDPSTWTMWVPATWNAAHISNNDEYQAAIGSTLMPGTYYYASRFTLNNGPFIYGGLNGIWNGGSNPSGVLTVDANPTQCATNHMPSDDSTVPAGIVVLTWDAPATGPAPTGYQIFTGTTSGALALQGTVATTTANFNAPLYSTEYFWMVVPTSAVGGDATGCMEMSFTTEADPFAPYCSGVVYSSDVEPITLVNFAGINNASSNVIDGSPSLENFTAVEGNVTAGESYDITIKGNTGGNFVTNLRVFIDWNQDADFDDAGETYDAGSVANSDGLDAVEAVTSIAVPGDALSGSTRMRVKKLFGVTNLENPCLGGSFGQTEDYTLNVSSGCTPTTWYADADGDGFGNIEFPLESCDQPAGYVANSTDCDDTNADIWQTGTFFVDSDGDGYDAGSADNICYGVGAPIGYSTDTAGTDCDDNNSDIFQSALLWVDMDGDGYTVGGPVLTCYGATLPAGTSLSTSGEDCDDTNAALFNNADLFVDNDGDGYTEGPAADICYGATIPAGYSAFSLGADCDDTDSTKFRSDDFFIDLDGDGYHGDNIDNVCYGAEPPANYSLTTLGFDCNDNNAEVNQSVELYIDSDGDGYDAGSEFVCAGSEVPPGYSLTTNGSDCDDNDSSVWQSADLYIDTDGDGYDGGAAPDYCYGATIPAGYSLTTLGSDCDDNDAAVWQSALLYIDMDGDGYDNGTATICYGMTIPAGYSESTLGSDCDDTNASIWQSAVLFIDMDGDGYDVGSDTICYGNEIPAGYSVGTSGSDCDDNDASVWQTANLYVDSDGDGYDNGTEPICYGMTVPAGYSETTQGPDCNDADASVWQSALLYRDMDGDGYDGGTETICYGMNIPAGYSESTSGSDCNDENAAINPGATEITGNGIDENCNGMGDDNEMTGQTTVIKPSQCGSTLPRIYSAIVAVANVPNVTMYTFEVTDENNLVQSISVPVNYFQLTDLADYQYDMDYSVRVALDVNGVWQGYGPACTVSTPGQNIVIPQCGTTLAQRNSPIFITGPSFISAVQIRVTNQSTMATQTITRFASWFTLKMFPLAGYAYSTSYSVEVRTLTTGSTYSDWTPACTITTPAAPGGKVANTSSPIKVVAYPNPYIDTFALNLQSSNEARVQVKVYDMVGKLLEVRDVEPTDLEAQRLGNAYPSGVYNVVVTQGEVAESVRVIKR